MATSFEIQYYAQSGNNLLMAIFPYDSPKSDPLLMFSVNLSTEEMTVSHYSGNDDVLALFTQNSEAQWCHSMIKALATAFVEDTPLANNKYGRMFYCIDFCLWEDELEIV